MWPLPGLLRRCGHVPRPVRTSPQKKKPNELQLFQIKRRQRIVEEQHAEIALLEALPDGFEIESPFKNSGD